MLLILTLISNGKHSQNFEQSVENNQRYYFPFYLTDFPAGA